MEKHLKEMKEITDKLAAIGSPIEEEDQVVTLLGSLPSMYATVVTALEARPEQVSLEFVQQTLVHEELKQTGHFDHSRPTGKSDAAMIGVQSKFKNKRPPPKCYKCGELGHFRNKCPKKMALDTKAPQRANRAESQIDSDYESVFCASEKESVVQSQKDSDWPADSGASSHMTWNKSILLDYEKFAEPQPVNLGDGRPVMALGFGRVRMKMFFVSNTPMDMTFMRVLYVPSLASNLFSVREVTSKGHSVLFEGDTCRIINQRGKVLGEGTEKGTLFLLNCKPYKVECANVVYKPVNDADLWHQRLGHINDQLFSRIVQDDLLPGVKVRKSQNLSFCEGCVKGKATRKPFKAVGEILSTRKLQLIHSDVWGPAQNDTVGGMKYFVYFTDDFSRCSAIYLMKLKSQVFDKFKEFEAAVTAETGERIGVLRTDNGGEYMSREFQDFLKLKGIKHQTTVPHTPEQNGVAERLNRTLVEKARTMLVHAGVPLNLWGEAVVTANYLKNRLPTKALKGYVTPYEKWFGRKPDVSHLKVFGCIAYAHVPDVLRRKLDEKAIKLRFIGYDQNTKGYRLYDKVSQKVYKRRDVTFNEGDFGHDKYQSIRETVTEEVSDTEENSVKTGQPEQLESQRPERRRGPPVRYGIDEYAGIAAAVGVTPHVALRASQIIEPRSLKEAMSGNLAEEWQKAANMEYQSLIDNETWELVELPPGRTAVGSKWVFKVKYRDNGEVERFKGRLVAQGYSQKYGIDYEETFSPVVKFPSIRTLLALAVQKGMMIHQMDVVTAFLNGTLDEEIYMKQPECFVKPGEEKLVCKLKKSLYGLKQSPRCWNHKFRDYMISIGFVQSKADPCVFIDNSDTLTIVAVWVDDLILITENHKDMSAVKKNLESRFKMKDLGALHYCLGISVVQDREGGYLQLHQRQYILTLLEKYGLMNAKPASTPADTNVHLVKDDGVSKRVDSGIYQSMVGSLLYAAIATRPDIAQAVSAVSKYNCNPSQVHLTAVKRIFRYLNGTLDLALEYQKSSGGSLVGYADSDWGGDRDDRHSTTGNIFMLSNGPVSWLSKKQSTVALSTTEAEYMALSSATQEAIWIQRLLEDLGTVQDDGISIQEDNQGAIALAKNPIAHARTKHIQIRYHFVREAVEEGIINLNYCPTEDMVADILTKPLCKGRFETVRSLMGFNQVKRMD